MKGQLHTPKQVHADLSLKLGSCTRWSNFTSEQWAAMEAMVMEHNLKLKSIKDRSASNHGLTIEKSIQDTTAKEKPILATTSGPQLSALSETS